MLILLALFTKSTPANELGDAEKAYSEATNRFYNQVYANPTMSRDEMTKLYNSTVVPARQSVSSAFSSTIQQQWNQITQSMQKYTDEVEERRRNMKRQATPGGAGNGAGKAARGSRVSPAPSQDTTPSQPEVVLDGKGIATEIEFKGKSRRAPKKGPSPRPTHAPAARAKTAPRATPAPSPTVIDIKGTTVPGGGVEEIEFGKKPAPAAKPSPKPAR
jgi:hypothetical protein